jgi:predicted ATP-binding protein involved in virulence
MKILKIKITKLFELFDYEIDLNQQEDLTIITGPNGFGKTTVLNIIYNLFSKKFFYFQKLNFEEINLYFDNELRLEIKKGITGKKETQNIVKIENNIAQIEEKTINLIDVHFNLFDKQNTNIGSFMYNSEIDLGLARELERSLPINRISDEYWIDRRTGKQVTLTELLNENTNFLSSKTISNIQKQGIRNEHILSLLNSINVYLIKAQRLIRQNLIDRRINQEREGSFVNTIEEYAKELASLINQKRQEAYLITQNLDSSFPKRLIECKDEFDEDEFKTRFNNLIEKQTKLQKYGFSTSKPELTNYDKQNAKVLSVYLKDSEQKTQVYDNLLLKIELFVNILNEKRFTFKTIGINRDKGFVFTSSAGKEIDLTDLSSGEQHEVVLLYELLFRTKSNTLILIDEPEISLHVTWQKAFIDDLLKIAKLQNISVLVATHSPQIINSRWNLTKDLFEISKKVKNGK